MTVKTKKSLHRPTVRSLDESVQLMVENMAVLTKTVAETDRRMAESKAEADRIMAESKAETDRVLQDLAETVKNLGKRVDEVLTGLGTIGNRLGDISEQVIIPGLRHAINKQSPMKHNIKTAVANKSFTYVGRNGYKQPIAEIDLYLSNGTEVLAVEIKSTLSVGYVNQCLNKLKKMREHEKEVKIENKKLYGAVAGVYIDPDARKFAHKNGLYVVEIIEEEEKLKVDTPKKCCVW
jgi:hypothetical protein